MRCSICDLVEQANYKDLSQYSFQMQMMKYYAYLD